MSGSVSDILTPFRKIKFDIFDNSNEQVDENKVLWYGHMATFGAQGGGHVQGDRSTEAELFSVLYLPSQPAAARQDALVGKHLRATRARRLLLVQHGSESELSFGVAAGKRTKQNQRRICR